MLRDSFTRYVLPLVKAHRFSRLWVSIFFNSPFSLFSAIVCIFTTVGSISSSKLTSSSVFFFNFFSLYRILSICSLNSCNSEFFILLFDIISLSRKILSKLLFFLRVFWAMTLWAQKTLWSMEAQDMMGKKIVTLKLVAPWDVKGGNILSIVENETWDINMFYVYRLNINLK